MREVHLTGTEPHAHRQIRTPVRGGMAHLDLIASRHARTLDCPNGRISAPHRSRHAWPSSASRRREASRLSLRALLEHPTAARWVAQLDGVRILGEMTHTRVRRCKRAICVIGRRGENFRLSVKAPAPPARPGCGGRKRPSSPDPKNGTAKSRGSRLLGAPSPHARVSGHRPLRQGRFRVAARSSKLEP